jgi:hypothetical protein
MDVAAVGDDEPVPLLERPWLKQIQQETEPRRIIQLWLANSRQILHRVAPLMRVMRVATGTDPELAAQWENNQQQTRTAYALLAQLLASRGQPEGPQKIFYDRSTTHENHKQRQTLSRVGKILAGQRPDPSGWGGSI